MSKRQKRMLIRTAVRFTILVILTIALISQSNAIHNLESQNEELTKRVVIAENLVIEMLYIREQAETEPPATEPVLTSLGEFRLTAYCHCEKCCGVWAENRPNGIVYTASGAVAEEGRTIAVDPSVIPYGTTVIINGHEYIAQDCGGAIKQNRIDIYFDDHQDALEFGVQYAEVFALERSETSGNDLC